MNARRKVVQRPHNVGRDDGGSVLANVATLTCCSKTLILCSCRFRPSSPWRVYAVPINASTSLKLPSFISSALFQPKNSSSPSRHTMPKFPCPECGKTWPNTFSMRKCMVRLALHDVVRVGVSPGVLCAVIKPISYLHLFSSQSISAAIRRLHCVRNGRRSGEPGVVCRTGGLRSTLERPDSLKTILFLSI